MNPRRNASSRQPRTPMSKTNSASAALLIAATFVACKPAPQPAAESTAVNPEFGTKADFKAFVDAAHALGLKVLLDWVPNHTAFDHTWITAHKDWYVTRSDGTIINARDGDGHDTDWTDVAELNYDNQD